MLKSIKWAIFMGTIAIQFMTAVAGAAGGNGEIKPDEEAIGIYDVYYEDYHFKFGIIGQDEVMYYKCMF